MLPPTLRSLDPILLDPLVGTLAATQRPFSIGFTAANEREGVTTIATNLASVLAHHHGLNVVVVDVNGFMPTLSRGFGLHDAPGVADILSGRLPLGDCLHHVQESRFSILPVGRAALNAGNEDGRRLPGIVTDLRQNFDIALFDCPPVERLRTMMTVAGAIEAMIFVLTAARTRRAVAAQALADLRDAGGRPLGALVNRRPRRIPAWLYRRL